MFLRQSALALLLCGSLAGCGGDRGRGERTVRKVTPEKLRADAAVLYKDLFAGRGARFIVVKPAVWPKSFERLRPERVGAYPDGFGIALAADADSESGIYVVPLHLDHSPKDASGARYERLADGVYWYAFAKTKQAPQLEAATPED